MHPLLTKYLGHIGISNQDIHPTYALLQEIITKHLKTFPYHNVYLFNEGLKPIAERTIPCLDIDSLIKLFIDEDKKGYCFQNTELLAWVLKELGFKVEHHLSRGIYKPSAEVTYELIKQNPINHELLIVNLDNKPYIVDTAYSHNSLRAPFPLDANNEFFLVDNKYKTTNYEDGFTIEVLIRDNWFTLSYVLKQVASVEEIAVANHQLFTNEQINPIRDLILRLGLVTTDNKDLPKRRELYFFKAREGADVAYISHKTGEAPVKLSIQSSTLFGQYAQRKFGVEIGKELLDKLAFKS